MIRQEAAGIYAWLPLAACGCMKKIEQIVREEQDRRPGAWELFDCRRCNWRDLLARKRPLRCPYGPEAAHTDRTKLRVLYGRPTRNDHEDFFASYVKSYKSLPLNPLIISSENSATSSVRVSKKRIHARAAIPLMKDAYSFDVRTSRGAAAPTTRCFVAYLRTFAADGFEVDSRCARNLQ